METLPKKAALPSLQDLHHDVNEAYKNDELNLLLNQQPIVKWVKEHPFAKGVKYIPIDKIEYMLTRIFQQWRVEVIDYKQMFNSVSCHIRLHYKNPITGQWEYHDGLGAVGVQVNKGEDASNLNAIKQDAVMKALPAAKSYAIKDAADHLGVLFGRDLNRKDTIAFEGAYKRVVEDIDYEEIQGQLDIIADMATLEKYFNQMPEYHKDKKFQQMFDQKSRTLNGNK